MYTLLVSAKRRKIDEITESIGSELGPFHVSGKKAKTSLVLNYLAKLLTGVLTGFIDVASCNKLLQEVLGGGVES